MFNFEKAAEYMTQNWRDFCCCRDEHDTWVDHHLASSAKNISKPKKTKQSKSWRSKSPILKSWTPISPTHNSAAERQTTSGSTNTLSSASSSSANMSYAVGKMETSTSSVRNVPDEDSAQPRPIQIVINFDYFSTTHF